MNIVFVHFGSRLPKHLLQNLSRTAGLFNSHQIFLISDYDHPNLPSSVNKFLVPDQDYFNEAKENLAHPVDFRNNFWFLTLKRFLVFNVFMKEHPAALIHFESDVIISPDFPFEIFEGLKKPFAFPLISDDLGIPSILFLKDKFAADLLCEFTLISSRENHNTTDMLILAGVLSKHPELVTLLPSGPSIRELYLSSTSNQFISRQSEGLSIFGGLFDGAAIGQYLLGDDPRNNRGVRNIYFESGYSSLRAKELNYNYSNSRNFLDVIADATTIPLFALHVHSKDVRAFREDRFARLIRIRIRDNQGKLRKEFLPSVASKQLFFALKRRLKRAWLVHRND